MIYFLILVLSSFCGIGWVTGVCGSNGIFKSLPGMCDTLPDILFIPLFQCSACNAFWWGLLISLLVFLFGESVIFVFLPLAGVGLTKIITNVTAIN